MMSKVVETSKSQQRVKTISSLISHVNGNRLTLAKIVENFKIGQAQIIKSLED